MPQPVVQDKKAIQTQTSGNLSPQREALLCIEALPFLLHHVDQKKKTGQANQIQQHRGH